MLVLEDPRQGQQPKFQLVRLRESRTGSTSYISTWVSRDLRELLTELSQPILFTIKLPAKLNLSML